MENYISDIMKEGESIRLPRLCKDCFQNAMVEAGEDYSADDPLCKSVADTARDYFNETFACARELLALEELLSKSGEIIRRADDIQKLPKKFAEDHKKLPHLIADDYEQLQSHLYYTQIYFGRRAAEWLRSQLAALGFYFNDQFTIKTVQMPLSFTADSESFNLGTEVLIKSNENHIAENVVQAQLSFFDI